MKGQNLFSGIWNIGQDRVVLNYTLLTDDEPIEQKHLQGLGENVFYHHWPISMAQRLNKIGKFLETHLIIG